MPSHQQRAYYDENGNIVIPGNTSRSEEPVIETRKERVEIPDLTHKISERVSGAKEHLDQFCTSARDGLYTLTTRAIREGSDQYQWSLKSTKLSWKGANESFKEWQERTWSFLMQPVLVPRKKKPMKELSRLRLFTEDVLRFGSTFAVIFLGLFVSLNYQSFWQIVSSRLDPLEEIRSSTSLVETVNSALRDKLMRSPRLATAGNAEGDLLSYLPEVGPPENRLIVPKLNLNVPLVTPSFTSLLEEDWEGVERDIQDALKYGVVHYPGTARPGQAGNFFVTGHSSYYPWAEGDYKTVFARLHNLKVGDEYWIYYGGDRHRYIVQDTHEVKPADVTVLDQPSDRRIATLMTCTPVGTTLRRLIITAQEVDPVTGLALEVGEKSKSNVATAKPQALPI